MKLNKGFTLIELIVVMAVFLFVIGAAIGIFLSIISSQKRVLAQQQILNQISYVEEYMSKALRMAKTDKLGICINPGNIYELTRRDAGLGIYTGIKFLNQSYDPAVCQEFFLDNTDPTHPVLKEVKIPYPYNQTPAPLPVALTSTNLKFDSVNPIRFLINGSSDKVALSCVGSNQCLQPRITTLLKVLMPGDSQSIGASCNSDTPCALVSQGCDLSIGKCVPAEIIQTTVSRRNLNVQQ